MFKINVKNVLVYKGDEHMSDLRTNIKETIGASQYDQQVKKVLANNRVVAFLLKNIDCAYQNDSLDEIIRNYLLEYPR